MSFCSSHRTSWVGVVLRPLHSVLTMSITISKCMENSVYVCVLGGGVGGRRDEDDIEA